MKQLAQHCVGAHEKVRTVRKKMKSSLCPVCDTEFHTITRVIFTRRIKHAELLSRPGRCLRARRSEGLRAKHTDHRLLGKSPTTGRLAGRNREGILPCIQLMQVFLQMGAWKLTRTTPGPFEPHRGVNGAARHRHQGDGGKHMFSAGGPARRPSASRTPPKGLCAQRSLSSSSTWAMLSCRS